MPARVIDGRSAALELRTRIATLVERFRAEAGRAPGLATVLVGEDPASGVYVRSKGKATREAGMESVSHQLPADVGEVELLALVERLNADQDGGEAWGAAGLGAKPLHKRRDPRPQFKGSCTPVNHTGGHRLNTG